MSGSIQQRIAPVTATASTASESTRKRPWPRSGEEWKALLDEPASVDVLSDRERRAMTIQHVDWPAGAPNLEYMTQREMAAKLGISVVSLRMLLHRAEYKLGLTTFPPRMNKIPAATRRELLAATHRSPAR